MDDMQTQLDRLYPEWRTLTGLPTVDSEWFKKSEYMRWLHTMPEYAYAVLNTTDIRIVMDSFDRFKEWSKSEVAMLERMFAKESA